MSNEDNAKLNRIELEKNFQVYVGIDFGTDGTGLAYALPTGEVFVHQKWKGYKRSVEVKPKTRILLDANGNFLAFGQPATNSYITMGGEKTGWMLFERFKMALYDRTVITDTDPQNHENETENEDNKDDFDKDNNNNEREQINELCDTLTAVNGKKHPSDSVFIEALKYIKSQVFKFFTKNKLQIENIDDIQWILTVPAIWSEKAKYKMEQWAHTAGLINKQIPNHLKIVYEPDCASLSIQYEIQKLKQQQSKMSLLSSKSVKSEEANTQSKSEEVKAVSEDNKDKEQNTDEQPSEDIKADTAPDMEPKPEDIDSKETEETDTPTQPKESEKSMSVMKPVSERDLHSYTENKMESHWLKGEKYVLIDAGGGTCDVACHEILGDFAVQEIVHPTGGPWGSTYIDDYFVQLLYKIFNREWIVEFKREDPAAYTELIDNFRVAKQEFWSCESDKYDKWNALEFDGGDDGMRQRIGVMSDDWHNVQLPFDFCTFLEEKVEEMKEEIEDCDLETLVEETEIFDKGLLSDENKTQKFMVLEDEYLRLNYFVWTHELFDKVIDPILNHCRFLLNDTIMKNECNYVCLVGGLGSSKYLQFRMKAMFGPLTDYGLNIIIPSRPILSVVDGAARFGLQPDYIQARTLSKTYGNAIDPKIDVIDIDALPPGYLEANQYRCDHTNVLRVRNIFSVYARKNQTIHIHDKPIIRKYKRFNIKQKKVRISVYSSDEQDPKVVKNKPCAKTTVVFPANSTELSIIVELYFSDTKIRVFAYPEDDPQNKKEMELDYEYK